MKLYNSIGPNPRMVRIFAAEKSFALSLEEVDIMSGENRQSEYLSKNPAAQLPALELENGEILSEITSICEYLDEKGGSPSLIGETAEERAATRMWTRRIDLGICEPIGNGFRFSEGLPMFENRLRCIPEAAEGLKACAQDKLKWLDTQMQGKDFVTGKRFTMADALLFAFLEFGASVGQPVHPDCSAITAWYARMAERPSVTSTA